MKKRLFKFGAILAAGTLFIGSAFEILPMVFCGLLAIGLALIAIALFPDAPEQPTNWPAGSSLPGGIEQENEIAEQGAFMDKPAFGRWGDSQVGFKWTGKDPDGNYAEYITWFIDGKKSSTQRVK